MENQETTNTENKPVINEEAAMHLAESCKWAKFIAIIGFITMALIAIGILSVTFMSGLSSLFQVSTVAIYLIIILLYLYPTYMLYRFSTSTRDGIEAENESIFNDGISSLKSAFKFVGILTLVMIVLYAFAIIFVIYGASNLF